MRSRKSNSVCLMLFFVPFFISCDYVDRNTKKQKTEEISNEARAIKSHLKKDECYQRIQKILKWYLVFFENDRLNTQFITSPKFDDSYAVTPQRPENVSATKYYTLDKKKLGEYLDALRKSGYFSQTYLSTKEKDILVRGKALEAAKQNDGPAEGFEFDEVFRTQEMYEPEHIQNLKSIPSIAGAYALPVMDGYGWILYTKYENGMCVIDSVGSLDAD